MVIKLSDNPTVDTTAKLAGVAVLMFAFVFVVMVPLYDVLCDALGINGKPSGQAYTAVQARVDESRAVTIQFLSTNNAGMPWEFAPSTTAMKVHPGATNDILNNDKTPSHNRKRQLQAPLHRSGRGHAGTTGGCNKTCQTGC